jgi:hypothetical protein
MTFQTAPHLALATAFSVVLHLAALVTYSPSSNTLTAPATSARALQVRVESPPPAAPARSAIRPPAERAEPPAPKPGKREATPPAPRPVAPAPSPAEPSPPYFPTFALTRVPTLLTTVSPDDWPSTPGAPSGSFQIELDIGADGRVMQLRSICEPRMCEAAAIYCGTLTGWRFVPAEILGHPVPSRIRIEFELENPADQGFSVEPTPLPQSPTRQ